MSQQKSFSWLSVFSVRPAGRRIVLLAGLLAASVVWPAQTLTEQQSRCLSKAHRHDKHGWIFLSVSGEPWELGFQHGYLLATDIQDGLRVTRKQWHYESGMEWEWLVAQVGKRFMSRIDKANLAELKGLVDGLQAAGVTTSLAELVTYNGIIEWSGYWWPQEKKKISDMPAPPVPESCSAFIATGGMTRDGGVVLGHNTMSSYETSFPNVIMDLAPSKGYRILMQTSAGWIHSGTDFFITSAGLVGAETTIGDFEGFDGKGIPEFVRVRRAMQDAAGIAEWCEIMKKGNNGGYANAWLLGDVNTGEIARLELGLKYTAFEIKKDGYFTGSNVAEDLKILRHETSANEVDIRDSAVARRVRWKQLMTQYAGQIDLEAAKRFEADHYDVFMKQEKLSGRDLCGHFEMDREPAGTWPGVPYGPAGTIDGKVVDSAMAKRMSFAARWGSACGTPFDAQQFLQEHPQFDWMKDILYSRPSQPWTVFTAGEKDSH